MKMLSVTFVVFGIFLFSRDLSAKSDFVPGINDLPLMSGLILKTDSPIFFDTPSGRIIEILAVSKLSIPEISSFYKNTLPQLGWKNKDKDNFERDGELLKIEIFNDISGGSVVRFFLVPTRN